MSFKKLPISPGIGRPVDPVAVAVNEVGDRWSFLILRECFFGVHRFVDFQRNLGIARNILSERLNRLTEHRVLERRRYQDRPVREEYRLTEKGCDLYRVIVAFVQWGERWVLGTKPLWLRHRDCGGEIGMYIFCEACGESLGARQVRFTAVYREGCGEAESCHAVSSAGP